MLFLDRSATREWRPGTDFRVICDCQRHSRRRDRWRRATRIVTRGVAVLATVPFAYFFDIPTKAMNLDLTALRPQMQLQLRSQKVAEPRPMIEASNTLTVFTTPSTSEQFLSTATVQQIVTIDAFKEQYFRSYVPYGSIIYREARKNNLAPELVAAMVHTESDFRPGLVSHKSAQGLMQIVPDTARDLGLGNVFDPEQNIAAGTRYFRYLLDRFDNERIALAAYNAGEGKVERCGCVPSIAETEQYIAKVNVRASRYRQRVRNGYMAMTRMRPEPAH
jgi:soluble lytic murein transglycosylase-like protein